MSGLGIRDKAALASGASRIWQVGIVQCAAARAVPRGPNGSHQMVKDASAESWSFAAATLSRDKRSVRRERLTLSLSPALSKEN
jgi:hypothetical protein